MARIIPDKTAGASLDAQPSLFSALPPDARPGVTYDNGTEFTRHAELRDGLGMATYFADPYSSWQRGSNENRNGMIRRYLPKRAAISPDMTRDMQEIVDETDNRPMRELGYRTPAEAFTDELPDLQPNKDVALTNRQRAILQSCLKCIRRVEPMRMGHAGCLPAASLADNGSVRPKEGEFDDEQEQV